MGSCVSSLHMLLWPGKPESASVSFGGFKIDRSAEDFDILAHHCEPHAAAFHPISGLQSLEHLENLIMEPRRNARAVVLHREGVIRPTVLRRHLDAPFIPVVMLDGVADEVHQNLLKRHPGHGDPGEAGTYLHGEALRG